MKTRASAATTRSLGSARFRSAPRERLLAHGQELSSAESGRAYRVARLLGAGGFGQVYLAQRAGRASGTPLCIKVSRAIDGWLREAYFGQMLAGHARAIRIEDAFPVAAPDGGFLYCLALEWAPHGDLRAYLHRERRGWPERLVRREIAGVLDVLGRLHRGQLLHRDLTPLNVFVCEGPRLKLGDFGITRPQGDRRGVRAHTMNALTAPSEILAGQVPQWQARDDVYQVGQLLGMLVRGDARTRLRTAEIRALPCSDALKEIIHRCIGERRKRYESADELIAALRKRVPEVRSGRLASLAGVHLAFTGILDRPRAEAARAAKRAGAVVHSGPSTRTTVLVRGRPNPLQAAGREAGLKLMEIRRLRDKGHHITVLGEAAFWRLAGHAGSARPTVQRNRATRVVRVASGVRRRTK